MGFLDYFKKNGLKENTGIEGRCTVKVRHWNPETKTYGDWIYLAKDKKNLLTNDGRDLFHAQCYTNTSAGTRGSGFIALSENATAPADGDTAVAGEISTNGLARADATTKTHTTGTATTTIQHTFTAAAAFTAVQKSGLFNASSGVTLTHENTFTSTALATNDQLQVTWTLTLND